jgi:hypothetical protein
MIHRKRAHDPQVLQEGFSRPTSASESTLQAELQTLQVKLNTLQF